MKNELLTIGPLTVYGYGFMIAVGVFAAWAVTEFRAKRQNLESEHIFSLVVWCLLGGLFCAKILFWITEWESIAADPKFLLETLTDGFVVYGGILGGVFSGWLYCHVRRISFWTYFDLVMPSVALAQGFGRIGCFLAGCCYGKETDGLFAVTFQTSDFAPNHVPLMPTQIYSCLLDFLNFVVLLQISKHKKNDGQVGAMYLIFYSIGRFVLEFFRGDLIRGNVGVLSTSQFISVFIFVAGVIVFIRSRNKS